MTAPLRLIQGDEHQWGPWRPGKPRGAHPWLMRSCLHPGCYATETKWGRMREQVPLGQFAEAPP